MSEVRVQEKLRLKNIYELLGEHFYIPAYQRGYRWSEIQVKELLDDIWEFSQQTSSEKSAFYCLQPIVVVKRDDHWELVDGQQRLTTLYIILHFLEKEHLRRELQEAYKKPLYTLEYETRLESASFLKNIRPAEETNNIDFFHIARAYEAVSEWFDGRDFNENNAFLSVLLAKPETAQSVKVIWYDLTDECVGNDYAVDVFSRINIGKIPLTNAELVKALFLQRHHFDADQAQLKQIQIASEWDSIEKQLQAPDFWYFIHRSDSGARYETRIEFIFDLMKGKKVGAENYFTFHKFNADFKEGNADIGTLWKGIKDYFLTFDEWYRDRELYHLIGFLVDCGEDVVTLKKASDQPGTSKTAFKNFLKDRIRERVRCELTELNYGDPLIKRVLLLFNIQTLLATKEADIRFPFDRYKRENWDIEHIRSQTDTVPTGSSRIAWLEDMLGYFQHAKLTTDTDRQPFVEDIERLLKQPKLDEDDFEGLYGEICDHFGHDDVGWADSLGNLALLDANTNRSYKNALYPVKRTRIIENDMRGIFVPICTKNVFLKFYSRSSRDLLYWQESDANDYLAAIEESLSEYLPEQGGLDA